MKRGTVFGMGIALAALLAAGPAAAGDVADDADEETTELVDWDDAAMYAELLDTFVGDGGVLMAVYSDDAQNVLWRQPASLPVADATAALEAGAEHAAALLVTQWILPYSLWICHDDKDADPDCSPDGHKFTSFTYWQTVGNIVRYTTQPGESKYENIKRVRAAGTSYTTDYCDAYYVGQYSSDGTWLPAGEDWCTQLISYNYYLDESDDANDFSYDCSEGEARVARFHFHLPSGAAAYSEIWFNRYAP